MGRAGLGEVLVTVAVEAGRLVVVRFVGGWAGLVAGVAGPAAGRSGGQSGGHTGRESGPGDWKRRGAGPVAGR
ncbi:MAG: hypothetical protein ABSF95_06700 [Verrucomicrobiota bacterium]